MAAVFIVRIPTREYEQKLDERKVSDGSSSLSVLNATTTSTDVTSNKKFNDVSSLGTDNGGRLLTHWKKDIDEPDATTTAIEHEDDRFPPRLPPRHPPPPFPGLSNESNSGSAVDGTDVDCDVPGTIESQSKGRNSSGNVDASIVDDYMETVLKIGLNKLKIEGAVWQLTEDNKFFQISFPCDCQERCEIILRHLCLNGIGTRKDSIVSVVPCAVYYQAGDEDDEDDSSDPLGDIRDNDNFPVKEKTQKTEFLKSIKARLTVAQVVDGVRGGATLTFDFVAFVILANFIAAFGLMDSSPVTVVASMLVSPLMGPIMALCFGAVIRDMSLLRVGIKSELVGLCICICVGFILGLIISPWSISWGKGIWPTGEMFARGQARCLWVGMLVAMPSGAGVALSLLGGNAGCLVGVAISASLLPPAVNAGLLWSNALVITLRSLSENHEETILFNGQQLSNKPSLLPAHDYECQYSTNMAYESAALGAVSLCLTLVNIACIILMAIAVLKIKEVAPVSSMPATSRFWREDIKIARDYNKTVHRHDSTNLGAAIAKEWAERNGSSTDLVEMVQEAMEDDEVYQTVVRCTAGQYTLPPRTRDRIASMTPMNTNGAFMDSKPAIWDVTFSSPTRMTGRRRTTMSGVPAPPPMPLPFETNRQSRVSFITEALNPHFASHYMQDGGAVPINSTVSGGDRVSNVGRRQLFSGSTEASGNLPAIHGVGLIKNRFKVTKADDCGSLVVSGAPMATSHSGKRSTVVLQSVVPEEVQMDFRE